MKKIISKIFVLIAIMFTSCAKSQNNNLLSFDQYKSIEIGGVTLNSINETRGVHQDLNNLFNKSFQYSETDIPDNYREVSSSDFTIEFINNSHQTDYEISSIKILSNDVQVKIVDKNISIGDSIDSLGNVEIKNNTVSYKINSNSSQFLLTSISFLLVVFDENTRLVTGIEFIVMT